MNVGKLPERLPLQIALGLVSLCLIFTALFAAPVQSQHVDFMAPRYAPHCPTCATGRYRGMKQDAQKFSILYNKSRVAGLTNQSATRITVGR